MPVITGETGLRCNITKSEETTTTGESTVSIVSEDAIGNLPILSTDIIASMSGTVSTSASIIDLTALQNVDDLVLVKGTAPIVFASIKAIYVHNKELSDSIVIKANASESFLASSDQITIPALSGASVYCGGTLTITADVDDKFTIEGAGATDSVEIYFLGA